MVAQHHGRALGPVLVLGGVLAPIPAHPRLLEDLQVAWPELHKNRALGQQNAARLGCR